MWMDTKYEPGTVKVIAYDKDGNAVAEKEMKTAGKPYRIELTADRDKIMADGKDLSFVTVKVSVGDTFAETPASKDSYETTDLGRAIEKADYKMGEDGGVIAFIVANKDKNIQLQFIGDRTYKTAMQPNDRKAIAELTELARILSGMEQIRKDKKEANLKIEFVTRKMQEQEEEK